MQNLWILLVRRSAKCVRFLLLTLIILPLPGRRAEAQVSSSAIRNLETFSFRAKVLDSETSAPVSYASAYLTHREDSTICAFCFTDDAGQAILPQVAGGEYTLYIEMFGYEPYARFVSTKGARNAVKDEGTISLVPKKEMLDAAVVTDKGRDVKVIKDTVIINATMFHQSGGDNLADLLKKMPGMELTRTGVSFNGKSIDNITVGGHTFFLNDPAMALNNLPARVVQNIKVYPEEKRQIMDIGLKQEYLNNFLGTASLSAGYDTSPGTNSSVMGSYFGEKANHTALASVQTLDDPLNATIHTVYGGKDESVLSQRNGVEKSAMAGIDAGGIITVKYSEDRKSVLDSTTRLSYYNDVASSREEVLSGESNVRMASAAARFSRQTASRLRLDFNAGLNYERNSESSVSSVNATNGFVSNGLNVNASVSATKSMHTPGSLLRFVLTSSFSTSKTDGCDQAINWTKDTRSYNIRAIGMYRRPLGKKVTFVTRAMGSFNPIKTDRVSALAGYSYRYEDYFADITEFVGFDLMFPKAGMFNVGIDAVQSHTSRWDNYVSPLFSYRYNGKGVSLNLDYKGQSSQPDKRFMSRVLDISDPTAGLVGNEQLTPSFTHALSSSLNCSGKRSSLMARLSYNITQNPIVNATWYNLDGRRFIRPVNSDAPRTSLSTSLTFNTKFGPDNCFRLTLSPSYSRVASFGLLARGVSDIADVQSFDYDSFEDWFTGGDVFKKTSNVVSTVSGTAKLGWTSGGWHSVLSAGIQNNDFLLDADELFRRSLWKYSVSNETGYTFRSKLELTGQVEYTAYKGYQSSLARPATIVNFAVSYPFKKLTVFLHAVDLLNQRTVFTNVMGASYVSDTRSLVPGRTVLAGVSFNFGTKAAAKIGQMRSAAMSIMNH